MKVSIGTKQRLTVNFPTHIFGGTATYTCRGWIIKDIHDHQNYSIYGTFNRVFASEHLQQG